eukprot:6364727-Lingulodinium_polyedra.AAC.2
MLHWRRRTSCPRPCAPLRILRLPLILSTGNATSNNLPGNVAMVDRISIGPPATNKMWIMSAWASSPPLKNAARKPSAFWDLDG